MTIDVDDFYYSLQRYSALYRILLARPYSTKIYPNQWNRVYLKLVNEFGLPLKGEQSKKCWLEVGCQLLTESEGKVRRCSEYSIQFRPLQHDGWELDSTPEIAGFEYSADGDFEYMVHAKDEKLINYDSLYYIQIFPTCQPQQTVKAFPLMIGPLYMNEIPSKMSCLHWRETPHSQAIFHGYQLEDESFLIIREDWDLGTPGKMWDSALVISHMLSEQIAGDPTCFKGKRILDLSAGTGCVGLLIASIYKPLEYRPTILMTDLREALSLIYQNRQENHLEEYADIKQLEWGNYDDAQDVLKDGPLDTIIASDVLYKPSSFPSLVQTLDWLSRDNADIHIYLGYKRRGMDLKTEQTFFEICSEIFKIRQLTALKSSNEGWILNELSDICKDTGVTLYQLERK